MANQLVLWRAAEPRPCGSLYRVFLGALGKPVQIHELIRRTLTETTLEGSAVPVPVRVLPGLPLFYQAVRLVHLQPKDESMATMRYR
ncbi:MAG TPA: hypothetical protein VJU02_08745 [Nitrospiraceae bacterium]|nr:hypothetical protein [Nitrospiraceae bacterium]